MQCAEESVYGDMSIFCIRSFPEKQWNNLQIAEVTLQNISLHKRCLHVQQTHKQGENAGDLAPSPGS